MSDFPEGRAIVYCEGAFNTTNGKTAHGLVRRSRRYDICSVVDSVHAGKDAGEILDGKPVGIPVVASLEKALLRGSPTHFVVGLAPDGGRLDAGTRAALLQAIHARLHVVCGLHDFLAEDPEIVAAAEECEVTVRDVRMPPSRDTLHFFDGSKIGQVESLRVALLGTDSAVGKRTTAWMLVDALVASGHSAELIGTGQTAWLQGSRYGLILDSLVNDFISGEIEHAIWRCWTETLPEVMVLEGQGSLLNPAYPGGFELLAAGRPHAVILQHAPARTHYDGFPEHRMHSLDRQIRAIKAVSDKPVVAVTVNHEKMTPAQVREACSRIAKETGVPAVDVLLDSAAPLVEALHPLLKRARA